MSLREEQDPEENWYHGPYAVQTFQACLAAHTSQYSLIAKLIAYIYAARSSQLTPPLSFLHSRRNKQTRTLLRPTFPLSPSDLFLFSSLRLRVLSTSFDLRRTLSPLFRTSDTRPAKGHRLSRIPAPTILSQTFPGRSVKPVTRRSGPHLKETHFQRPSPQFHLSELRKVLLRNPSGPLFSFLSPLAPETPEGVLWFEIEHGT